MTTLINEPIYQDDWQNRKPGPACTGAPLEWFITRGDDDDEPHTPDPRAEALCKRCPVVSECLAEALVRDRRGTWGGMTYYQRRQLQKKRLRRQCPGCRGIDSLKTRKDLQLCLACGTSWNIF